MFRVQFSIGDRWQNVADYEFSKNAKDRVEEMKEAERAEFGHEVCKYRIIEFPKFSDGTCSLKDFQIVG